MTVSSGNYYVRIKIYLLSALASFFSALITYFIFIDTTQIWLVTFTADYLTALQEKYVPSHQLAAICSVIELVAFVSLLIPWVSLAILKIRHNRKKRDMGLLAYRNHPIYRFRVIHAICTWLGTMLQILILSLLHFRFWTFVGQAPFILYILFSLAPLVDFFIETKRISQIHPANGKEAGDELIKKLVFVHGCEDSSTFNHYAELATIPQIYLLSTETELEQISTLIGCPVPDLMRAIRIHIFRLHSDNSAELSLEMHLNIEGLKAFGGYRLDVSILWVAKKSAKSLIDQAEARDRNICFLQRIDASTLRVLSKQRCYWLSTISQKKVIEEYVNPQSIAKIIENAEPWYERLCHGPPALFELFRRAMHQKTHEARFEALFSCFDALLHYLMFYACLGSGEYSGGADGSIAILESLLKDDTSYTEYAKSILFHAQETQNLFPDFQSKTLSIREHKCFQALEELFELEFEDKEANFAGMIELLWLLRRKTKAHGTTPLRSHEYVVVFQMCCLLWICAVMRLDQFTLVREGDEVLCGYHGRHQSRLHEGVIISENHLCYLFKLGAEEGAVKKWYREPMSGRVFSIEMN